MLEELLNNTEAFLDNNLLTAGLLGTIDSVYGRPQLSVAFEVGVRLYEKNCTKIGSDKKIDMYSVEQVSKWNAGLPKLKIYYCHYETDAIHTIIVDDEANLMLTPTMDGCSFGVGSATRSGARLVGHVNVTRNKGGEAGSLEAIKQQDDMIKEAMPNAALMSGGEYRPFGNPDAGTTIGVRNTANGQWRFYTQFWYRPPSTTQYYLKQPSFRRFA